MLTRRLTFRVLCVTITVVCIVYITISVLYSEIVDGRCDPNIGGTLYSSVLYEIPDTALYLGILGSHLGLYLAVLFTLTPIIIVKFYQEKETRQQLTTPEQNIGHFKTIVKLVFVLVSFIVLAALAGTIFAVIGRSGVALSDESQTLIAFWLVQMRLLYHSTNFLLYSTVDIKFRAAALSLYHIETVPLVGTGTGAEMFTFAEHHNLAVIEATAEVETSFTVTENQPLAVFRDQTESETSLSETETKTVAEIHTNTEMETSCSETEAKTVAIIHTNTQLETSLSQR